MDIRARAEVSQTDWDAFVDTHPNGWFWHTSHWLNYSLAYSPASTDLSFAAIHDGAIRALVPLIRDTDKRLVMGGQVTPAPLLRPLTLELAMFAQGHATELLDGEPPLPIQMRPGWIPEASRPNEMRAYEHFTHVVNLGPDEPTLWRNLRKSYKSLIHRADREYEIIVHAKPEPVDVARFIHQHVAGRQTRSADTWRLMGEWTTLGHAIIVTAYARTPDMSPCAFAYIIRYKEWAYYASGASLVPNVSHALQWHAIRALRAGDTRFYEIGHDAGLESTKKDQGIAHFKAGFGAAKMPLIVVAPSTWRDRAH